MKLYAIYLFLGISSLFLQFQSCSNNEVKKGVTTFQTSVTTVAPIKQHFESFAKGKEIPKIICESDSLQSYALYLPSNYSTDKKWPVIYCFDPHASGLLPVSLYKNLAEKYGYVLIGSNNSQNGTTWDAINASVQTLMDDTHARISIDNKRVYLAGFSGGARVAGLVAEMIPGITGVIGCGAGINGLDPGTIYPFSYIGIVGNKDFNYNEMQDLIAKMGTNIRHQLIVYNGKHQWAPVEIMNQAFEWITLNAMKDKLIPKNDKLINLVADENEISIKKYEKENDDYNMYLNYRKMSNFLSGLYDVKVENNMIAELGTSDNVKKTIATQAAIELKERAIQQEYMDDLQSKDVSWWKDETKKLNAPSDKDIYLMNQRLLGFMSLATYMTISDAIQKNAWDAADHFNQIYAAIDPTNAEHAYLSACFDARKKQNDAAYGSLEEAVKLGFSDFNRTEKDSNFVALKYTATFSKIISQMKKKSK
ncbi:MAG: PHB depolymerase family esterase [Bacteroidia bacterium]